MFENVTSSEKALLDLKRSDDLKRQGIVFSTSKSEYLYDAGTGKVVLLDRNSAPVFNALFNKTLSDEQFLTILTQANTNEIVEFINKEHLLCNPEVKHFINLNDVVKRENLKCEQLIIELTGKCNLCCKYCIYNDYYEGNRNFNTDNIDFPTAQKAIDYVYKHRHPDRLSITFYGGEPLINFDVMRKCIDYCLENLTDCKDLSFSFTTNLTLMTKEIADYLAQVPNLGIVLSMDGPEDIHNRARVYRNNQPTFKDAFRGLENLAEAVKRHKSNTTLIFNCVLMPPYTEERFDKINDFFESLDFLPKDTKVQATYPSPGTVTESYLKELKDEGIDPYHEQVNWMMWAKKKARDKAFIENRRNIYSSAMESSLAKIHNRTLYDKPMDMYYYNGCCIPGQRRLYLTTKGEYKLCERIGNSPSIGDVNSGIDEEAVKKYYLSEYEELSLGDCSKCWAIHLCDICYADWYDENGANISKKRPLCTETRERYKLWLTQYYELMETDPKKIEEISKLKFS